MKEQLEKLAQEMIGEIKELKDLTKKELPVIAKEYLAYCEFSYALWLAFTGIAMDASIYFLTSELLNAKSDPFIIAGCVLGIVIFGISTLYNIDSWASLRLQPRRHAIQAITSLF